MKKSSLAIICAIAIFGILSATKVQAGTYEENATTVTKEAIEQRIPADIPKDQAFTPENMKKTAEYNYYLQNPNYNGDIKFMTWDQYNNYKKDGTVQTTDYVKALSSAQNDLVPRGNVYEVNPLTHPTDKVCYVAVQWLREDGIIITNLSDGTSIEPGYKGSGFKVNDNHVGTAGHVIAPNGVFPNTGTLIWQPKPGAGGPYPQAAGFAESFTTTTGWLENRYQAFDYGSIRFRMDVGSVANFALEIAPAVNVNNVHAIGYPADEGWNMSWKPGRSDGNVIITGANGFANTTYQSNDMQVIVGMSGGPLLDSGYTVMGITTNKTPTRFVRITEAAYNTIVSS